MSKMITGGGAYDLRRRNKHCQIPPPRTLAILGGVAPKPPTVTDRVKKRRSSTTEKRKADACIHRTFLKKSGVISDVTMSLA